MRGGWVLMIVLAACGGGGKLVRKGDGYLDKGHYPAAIRTYKDVLDKNPDNVKALIGTARAWVAAGHPDRAVSPARRAAGLGSLDARIVLVEALVATGRGAEAVEEAERALASVDERDDNPKLVRLLAEARLSTGDLEGASRDLATALERMHDPELMSLAAYLAFRTGDVPRAKELIERAADSGIGQPEIASVEADAAALFMLFGDDDRYRESINILKSLVPDAEHLYLDQAVALDAAGSVESSLRYLHWSFALDPEDGRVARHIGLLYHRAQSWELALGFLQRAAKLQPYTARNSDVGVRYETTSTGSLSAEQIQTESVELITAMAECYEKLDRPLDAAATWEKALAMSNSATPADWLRVALVWERAGQADRAVKAAFVAVDRDSHNGEGQFLLAREYARAGDVDNAIGRARLAWQLLPNNPEVALFLGRLYEKRLDYGAAREAYATQLGRSPTDGRLRDALRSLEAQGR
jgi:tetratricopeptide (TPR) repeat protein